MDNPMMLSDVKIIDLCQNVAGPGISAIASDYGAEVIKIETMEGNPERLYAPMIEGQGMTGAWINRGKKSLTLNLKDPEAIEIIRKLAADTDVFIEGFRPGVISRLGLGYDVISQINPKIVYIHASAYGQSGPYADMPGYDVMAQALSGMISVTGEKGGRGIKHGITLADYFTGPNGYCAMMTALHYARNTGIGQEVDVSLLQGMIYMNSPIDRMNDIGVVRPNGSHHTAMCPFGGFYNSKGEGVVICAPSRKHWQTVADALHRPDYMTNPDYETSYSRSCHQEEIIADIEAWLDTFPDMTAAMAELEKYGVPHCRINTTEDVVNDPQVKHMGYLVQAPTMDNQKQETWLTRGPNAFFSKTPGYIHKAPTIGQHNYEILEGLGYTDDEIDRLMARMAGKKEG